MRYHIKPLLLLLTLWSGLLSVYPQIISSEAEQLHNDVISLTYHGKYESARDLVMNFLEQDSLSDADILYGNYLHAEVLRSSGKQDEAIRILQYSKRFLDNLEYRIKYESLIEGKLAESYFDLQEFKKAKEHALKSIRLNPDESIRGGGHAVNDLIIGYCDYEEGDYISALEYYQKAKNEYTRTGNFCELPLVYARIAKAYSSSGKQKEAEIQVRRAIHISDTCNIIKYTLISKHALFDIYRENEKYKEAVELTLEINKLANQLEKEKRDQLIDELEVEYKTRLVKIENENLKNINDKNNQIVAQQRQALIISIIAIIILIILSIVLIRISRQRKKAEQKLDKLNKELEKKVADRTEHLNKANEKIRENSALLAFQNKQLVDFCNIISHNLRAPLRNMSMLITFIEESNNENERQQYIEKLKPVINNLNETFGELVETLQVKQDLEIKSQKIVLSDCLDKILNTLEGQTNESDAVIKTDFKDAPVIHFPHKYLNSILHNLLSNALKYRSPDRKPEITLRTQRIKGNILLTVTDNGLGIDLKKYKHDVFKIRKVFHKHPDAKGFGLYLTKTQIETMGGRIWMESTPGKGSTFFIEFKDQESTD